VNEIHPSDVIGVYPACSPINDDFLPHCGQIPLDPEPGQIVSGDISTQTRRVMDNREILTILIR